MSKLLSGTRMPEHCKPKCSTKNCKYGAALTKYRVCFGHGIWWHPACPCWSDLNESIADPFIDALDYKKSMDLEDYVKMQELKDSLHNLEVWLLKGIRDEESRKEIVDIAYKELKFLMKAIQYSNGVPRKTLMKQLEDNPDIEIMVHLLALKLGASQQMVDILMKESL